MLAVLGGVAIVVVVLGLLAALLHALHLMIAVYVKLSLLLIGFWVAGNVVGLIYTAPLARDNELLAVVHRAWSDLFFYTSLLQATVFTVAVFWGGALLTRDDISAPASQAEFVLDFVKGSSVIAAVMFLGVTLYAMVDTGWLLRLAAIVYAVLVVAVAVAPWLPALQLEQRVLAQPGQVFWVTIGAYALLSATGMQLYKLADRVPVPPAS